LLLVYRDLDGTEHVGDFAVESRELKVDDAPPRMQHNVDRHAQRREVLADSLPHAALDPVAFDGLPHHFADRKSNPRACSVDIAQRRAVSSELRPQDEKVRHLFCELFPAGFVHTLIVGVFAKTKRNSSGGHTAGLDLMHVESRMTQF
jgi:hypothetical protein